MAALSAKDWATECARQQLKIQALQDDLTAIMADRDSHQREAIRLHEQVSFLESREVCAAAHENVETCGYCQRDTLKAALAAILSESENDGSLLMCGAIARRELDPTRLDRSHDS